MLNLTTKSSIRQLGHPTSESILETASSTVSTSNSNKTYIGHIRQHEITVSAFQKTVRFWLSFSSSWVIWLFLIVRLERIIHTASICQHSRRVLSWSSVRNINGPIRWELGMKIGGIALISFRKDDVMMLFYNQFDDKNHTCFYCRSARCRRKIRRKTSQWQAGSGTSRTASLPTIFPRINREY